MAPLGGLASSSDTFNSGVDVFRPPAGVSVPVPSSATFVPQRWLNGVWVGCSLKKIKKKNKKKKKQIKK
jgi:hypothetical protein